MASTNTQNSVTFVLVPGSFVKAAEHDKLESLLRDKGHTVTLVELLSANDGTRTPPATADQDADHIRAAILSILDNDKRNVVLGVHSYSGIPGSSALRGLSQVDRAQAGKSTSVVGVVYVASFLPNEGQSVRDIMADHIQEPYKSGVPGDYLPALPAEFLPLIFNDVEQEEAAKYYGVMTRHSSDSYSGKCTYAAWKDIPSLQIIPGKDVIMPVEVQELMYKNAVANGGKVTRVFVEGAGHCVNISQPELVVDELIRLASL